MSLEYKKEAENKNKVLTDKLLENLPRYVKNFIHYIEVTKSSNTILSYLRDLDQYFSYLSKENKKEIPIDVLGKIKTTDIKEYERFLSKDRNLSHTTIKRKMSSIASLYKYLNGTCLINNNPMINYDYPKAEENDILYLTPAQTLKILSGIYNNEKKIIERETGAFSKEKEPIIKKVPVNKSIEEKLKTEKFVLRDYAIFMLFLGTGLRVSELVGININDINFTEQYLLTNRKGRGNKITRVYFGDEVEDALKAYLYGQKPPKELLDNYPEDFLSFCFNNKNKKDFLEKTIKRYKKRDQSLEDFKKDLYKIARSSSRFGRNSLSPKKGEDALFLSSWGKRISVRSVQLMVKEMIFCYLPDLNIKDEITPHKLRSTAATRMLHQTGDILLVSKQLDHSSPEVTAKFYAKLLENEKKEKLSKLDVVNWDK